MYPMHIYFYLLKNMKNIETNVDHKEQQNNKKKNGKKQDNFAKHRILVIILNQP